MRSLVFFSLVLAGCAVDATETSRDAIIGGTVGHPRHEVGMWGGCTATLILPNLAIAAAHCGGHVDQITNGNVFSPFTTSTDGVNWGGTGQSFRVDRTWSLNRGIGLATDDVMLIHLVDSVPSSVATPAQVANVRPANGTQLTIFGGGCTTLDGSGAGFGTMRFVGTTMGATTNNLCPGDSGGPTFTLGPTDRGRIIRVNSGIQGVDVFGDVVAHYSEVNTIQWSTLVYSQDIAQTGWCTGANQTIRYADANGDGTLDAICHDRLTGSRSVAIGFGRLVRFDHDESGAWCPAAEGQLVSGDFNGDGRTDLLCHGLSSNRVDYADSTGHYAGTDFTQSTTWCTHSTARLHVGDFNGDGRSDLLCHDVSTGQRWFMYADSLGHFGSSIAGGNTFCSHTGAELHVGDFDADGKSDLLCYTASTGTLHLAHANSGSDPFGPITWSDTTHSYCSPSERFVVGDYNGDGRSDLNCLNSNGTSRNLFHALGTRSEQFSATISWASQSFPNSVLRVRTPRVAAAPWE